MNDLLMSGNLSERLSTTGSSGAIVTLGFSDEDNLTGLFISIEEKNKHLELTVSIDEHDQPFKYFGLSANKAIINTGSENLTFTGKFQILKIEKTN